MSGVRAMVVAVALALCGCARSPDLADWLIDVPDGTTILEYEEVADEARVERIDLVEELVVGGDGADPRYSFDNPKNVAVDADGRMLVADSGDHEVKIYAVDGAHVMSLGRQGEGPGEFRGPGSVTVAGDHIVVTDSGRTSFWSLEGDYLAMAPTSRGFAWAASGRADGSYLTRHATVDERGRQAAVLVRFDEEGQEVTRYPTMPDPEPIFYPARDAEPRIGLSVAPAVPTYATAPTGPLYLTPAADYQVFAFDPGGDMAWALRVGGAPRPVAQEEIDRAMRNIHTRWPEAKEGEVDWPASEPALRSLMVDGHGHLYVFPYVIAGLEPEQQRVDVYSSTGERLFSGWIPSRIWLWANRYATLGDHVYDIQSNDQTGEDQIVRFRLVEPF